MARRQRLGRVVVDTSVVIRAARAFRQRPSESNTPELKLIVAWRDDPEVFTWLYSQEILSEYREILHRLRVPKNVAGRFVNLLGQGGEEVTNPLYSYIVLATSNTSKEDGFLEAWEIMEMDLKTEIAVLSACETARGRVGAGEGMTGMTWALFVAGVPTTVASQWEVPSESTTKLMVTFHRNARKLSKAEAWRQATLEMIKDPRYRMKPFYWAGFVVVGDGGRFPARDKR